MRTRRYWFFGLTTATVAVLFIISARPRSSMPARSSTSAQQEAPSRDNPIEDPAESAAPRRAWTPPSSPVLMSQATSAAGPIQFRDDDEAGTEASRRIRREIWKGLEDYAKEADLTEAQWQRFLSALQESAVQFGYLLNESGNHRMDPAEFQPTSDDLGRELEENLAGVLDERQLRIFKFRFHSNLLPAQLARGNILQFADTPDQKAWTPSAEGVWPTDRL